LQQDAWSPAAVLVAPGSVATIAVFFNERICDLRSARRGHKNYFSSVFSDPATEAAGALKFCDRVQFPQGLLAAHRGSTMCTIGSVDLDLPVTRSMPVNIDDDIDCWTR
jgi:hypothetical protein